MSTIAAPLTAAHDPFGRIGPLVATTHTPIRVSSIARQLAVVVAATLLLAVAGLWLTQARSVAIGPAAPSIEVVVQPGDTVWQLASQHRPAGLSTQDYAMLIVLHNDVNATALLPGSVLELPQTAR